MKQTGIARVVVALLCLALAGVPGLSEDAAVRVEAVEVPAQEEEFVLAPEPADQVAEAELPSETAPETEPQPEAPEQPAEETPGDEVQPGPEEMRFSETLSVSSDTWEDVDIVREKGFKAPYAVVEGKLTLKNVSFKGKPAREINLTKAFTLGHTGSIAVVDDGDLALELSTFSFNKGDSRKLAVSWKGKALRARKAGWKSSNTNVVKVSKEGKITARKKGKATITVSYKGQTAVCRVVVTNLIQADSIAITPEKLTLSLNGTATLTAKIKPNNTTDKSVKWTSSEPSVVSVDEEGALTAQAVGSAIVTAVTANGKSAACKVSVVEIKPVRIDFARLFVTMNPGDTRRLKVNFQPEDASYRELRFTSDDKSVVSVDRTTGEITANGCGTATITARSEYDGGIVNTCRICVIEPDAKRMEGLIIGINPGHQRKTITKLYPIAPGSHKKAKGVKTGACGKWTRVNEYETVLQIGLKLADMLRREGATVVMTRTTNDVNLTNIDRATMLNEAGVDVALQLHCNSIDNRRAEGCSGYIRTTGDWVEESRAMSRALTDAISAQTGCVNLGVKTHNDYMSLNWTTTPSVLLEMGYISNRKEDMLLATDEYREKMAKGILEGLCDYFGR